MVDLLDVIAEPNATGDLLDEFGGDPAVTPETAVAESDPQGQTAADRGVTPGFQFLSEGVNRFADAVLGIPDAILTVAAQLPSPADIPRNAVNLATGSDEISGRTLFEDMTGTKPPAVGDQVLPIPNAEEIRAAASALVPDGSDLNLQQRFQLNRAEQEQRKQEFPVSTGAGQVAGDIATVATARGPLVAAQRAKQVSGPGRALVKYVPPGPRRALDDLFRSKKVSTLGKAAGKATEAGLEGATIAILQGGDPLEVAAFSSAGQLAGSSALWSLNPKGGLLTVAGAALAATTLLQMAKTVTPGGKNYILESIESGYEKATFATVAGLLAGAAGAGRLRGRQFQNMPRIVDGITTAPRAGIISVVNELTKKPDKVAGAVLETLATDPEFFSANERKRLDRAVRSPDVSFGGTVNDLLKVRDFRRRLENILPDDTPATQS